MPLEEIELRDVGKGDLPALFKFQADPESNALVGFVPKNKPAFEAHWRKILGDPAIVKKVIVSQNQVVGYLVIFGAAPRRELGYWIGRDHWGKGFASRAVEAFLKQVHERPLYAYIAKHNARSLRVAEKRGFKVIEENRVPAPSGGSFEQLVLELQN